MIDTKTRHHVQTGAIEYPARTELQIRQAYGKVYDNASDEQHIALDMLWDELGLTLK